MKSAIAIATLVMACAGPTATGPRTAFRDACAETEYWTGSACTARVEVASKLAASKEALAIPEVEAASAALAQVKSAAPLAHDANITLHEQLGIAAAFVDQIEEARAAFAMLLALDPGHFLSYDLSPKATRIFEQVRNEQQQRGAPAVEVNWAHGQRVGAPVPIDISVVADPANFLRAATLFVRTRGDARWRAADVALGSAGNNHRVVLPAIEASRPLSLELYLRAYDERGNEVLSWAGPARPREIPLRYDAPRPWWQRWWVIGIAGAVVVAGTGAIVYGVTRGPSEDIMAFPDPLDE